MARQTNILRLNIASVNDMIRRLDYLQSNIDLACELITEDMTEKGEELARMYDASAPQTGNNNYTFNHDVWSDSGSKGYISMEGSDSVYVEFGTGDVGASSPHPLHNDTPGIVSYNSGPTIKIGEMGHYWFAPKKMWGASEYYQNNGYTQGIPAGCQMYNTLNELKDIAPDIAKKHISQAITGRW